MSRFHAVAWLDHREAHVLHFTKDAAERTLVRGERSHLHHKRGAIGAGNAPEDHAYFEAVAAALRGAEEILVAGPAEAKHEFVKHLQRHDAPLAKKVVGVETLDHPSEGELLAFARRYFIAADRMRPGG